MRDRLRPLLPNEPRILNRKFQEELTEKFLLPQLADVAECLLAVRLELDPELTSLRPTKLGKPYPLGQCLEIAQAVEKRLRVTRASHLPTATAARGLQALHSFKRAGGTFRQVWGDLRGEFFQNAFLLGTLYVDVANDTVTPTKPKVEILPFDSAQFGPVRDFQHFAVLARKYWKHEVYPNHVLPTLAPHCPLIHVSASGEMHLHEATDYMLAMTRSRAFEPSEAVLRGSLLPDEIFQRAREQLGGIDLKVASSSEQGQRLALEQCRRQRSQRRNVDPKAVGTLISTIKKVNLSLGRLATATSGSSTPPMSTIHIDGASYELTSLSPEARGHLQSVQFVDQELNRLQSQIAAMQTARNAYMGALRTALSTMATRPREACNNAVNDHAMEHGTGRATATEQTLAPR